MTVNADTITVNQLCERALETDMLHSLRRTLISELRVLRFGYRVEPGAYAVARSLAAEAGVSVPNEADCRVDDAGHLVLFEGYGDVSAEALAADDIGEVCRWVQLRALLIQTQDSAHRSEWSGHPLVMEGDGAVERTLAAIHIVWGLRKTHARGPGQPPVPHRRPAQSIRAPKALSDQELADSYAVTRKVMRDALAFSLLLTFLLQTGARPGAALQLTRHDLLARPGMVRLPRKRGGSCYVPILPSLSTGLLDMAASRGATHAADQVFMVEGRSAAGYVPLSRRMIDVWCRKLQIGLDLDVEWSPHLLRQTLAARLSTVARPPVGRAFLGHEVTDPTQVPDSTAELEMREALMQLFAPVS